MEDFQRAGFGTVVQGRVALDTLPVDIRTQFDEVARDFQMSFVAGDHQTRVTVPIGYFQICRQKKTKKKQLFNNISIISINDFKKNKMK